MAAPRSTPGAPAHLATRTSASGGDGILELSDEGGVPRMTVWNPDGSQAENCGNGIRMVARHLEADGRLPRPTGASSPAPAR